jgi:methylmalonyl-CoA/ethylmalonyl-CoA epimerase
MRIKRIHHLTIAVRDLEGARLTFEQLFDVRSDDAVEVPAFGVRAIDVPIGDGTLQLASPVDADNPVMRFLERKGEGFYNLALEIEGLDETVRELAAQGVRVSEPIDLEPGVRSAFVTMAATHGMSVQLIEVSRPAAGPEDAAEPEAADSPDETAFRHAAEEAPLPEEAPPGLPPQLDLTPDEWSDVD